MRFSGFLAFVAALVIFGCGGGGGPAPGSVTINPKSSTLTLSDTKVFSASVVGSPGVGVNWTVTEGAAGGTVSNTGLYTAPNSPGVFHVVATSQADSAKFATATVTVQAGSASGNVQ